MQYAFWRDYSGTFHLAHNVVTEFPCHNLLLIDTSLPNKDLYRQNEPRKKGGVSKYFGSNVNIIFKNDGGKIFIISI